MMIGFFSNIFLMYVVDAVLMVVGLILMICSNDKFIGKAG